MSEFESKYREALRNERAAREWAEMLGKHYRGGRGGIGKLVDLKVSAATIYFQQYDGANNYHEAPKAILQAISESAAERMGEILSDAMRRLAERRAEAAAKFHAEMAAVAEQIK